MRLPLITACALSNPYMANSKTESVPYQARAKLITPEDDIIDLEELIIVEREFRNFFTYAKVKTSVQVILS